MPQRINPNMKNMSMPGTLPHSNTLHLGLRSFQSRGSLPCLRLQLQRLLVLC